MSDAPSDATRIHREKRTIEVMVAIYCQAHHAAGSGPCPACEQLLQYALRRLDHCPQRPRKPICAKCTIHCYRKEKRQAIRRIMRYAGPRMLYRRPGLALLHVIDRLRR